MRIWLSFYEHPQGGAARTVGRMSTLNDWQLLEVCLRWHHPPPPPPPGVLAQGAHDSDEQPHR